MSYPAVRSLPPDHQVIKELPIIPRDAFETVLRSCLSPYGNALQMCLYEEPSGGWFGGRSFAILGRLPNTQYADLTHRMCWNNSDTENTRSFFFCYLG